ncbi:MerR family DNA-binding transcriptional regulator [Kribbella sp. NPDC051620]|uniref:MerR family DNA-binding transcriptional regulator n=1 Tax=Kribbella sp. NPDC051620 TaxID=3364120 RepID=UPI0037A7BD53
MKTGELAERAGVSRRLLRHYEEQRPRLSERIECLRRNRSAIADYLHTVLSIKPANGDPIEWDRL